MSNQALTKQPKRAVETAGKNPVMQLNLDKNTVIVVPVAVVTIPQGGLEKLTQMNISQQPVTTNLTQITNNIIINNNNAPGTSNQNLQPTATSSRIIENEPSGVGSVPSASDPTRSSHHGGQNGTGDRANTSRPANGQTRPTRDTPKVDSSSNPTSRPTTNQVPTRQPHQEVGRRSASEHVPARNVQKEARREESQPKDNKPGGLFNKLLHSHSDREESPQPKAKSANSATRPAVSHSHGSQPNGSRENSTVRRPHEQRNSQVQSHHHHAPSEPAQQPAVEKPVARPARAKLQPRRQNGAVQAPHGQPAIERWIGPAPGVLKALTEGAIRTHLMSLDSEIKIKGRPARLILVGKASAEVMGLDTEHLKAYYIDVMLDLDDDIERLHEVRRCMAEGKVFREFDKPLKHDGQKAWTSFFGKEAHRAKVFNEVAQKSGRIFKEAQHLEVYLMDQNRAFEFELRRMAKLSGDRPAWESSRNTAVTILWPLTTEGRKPLSCNKCRDMHRIREDSKVPRSSINSVIKAIRTIPGPFKEHGKQGIVETRHAGNGIFEYQNIDGNWQRFE